MKVDEIMKKSKAMWWLDGIPELATGTISILLGIITYLQKAFEGCRACTVALSLLMMLLILSGPRIISFIKSRTTWEKVGYVVPSSGWRKNRTVMTLVVLLIILVPLLVALFWPGLWWAVVALLPFGVFTMVAIQSGLLRFLLYAVLCGLIPLAIARTCGDIGSCISTALILMGIPLLIGGTVSAIKFRKEFGGHE